MHAGATWARPGLRPHASRRSPLQETAVLECFFTKYVVLLVLAGRHADARAVQAGPFDDFESYIDWFAEQAKGRVHGGAAVDGQFSAQTTSSAMQCCSSRDGRRAEASALTGCWNHGRRNARRAAFPGLPGEWAGPDDDPADAGARAARLHSTRWRGHHPRVRPGKGGTDCKLEHPFAHACRGRVYAARALRGGGGVRGCIVAATDGGCPFFAALWLRDLASTCWGLWDAGGGWAAAGGGGGGAYAGWRSWRARFLRGGGGRTRRRQ